MKKIKNPAGGKDSYIGKTYDPLTVYYLPKDYNGGPYFYSPKYLQMYFDGYGFNFYTGEYNYY